MSTAPSPLRVLSLNIWNRQGPWEKRRALIRDGLARLQPDLVGLQEVLRHDAVGPDQAQELADGMGYHLAYGPAWHIGGGLWFGNAVLSRWPILRELRWNLPNVDGEEQRALLGVVVDAPFAKVPLFTTHLAWKLHQGALRLEQVAFIAARIAESAPLGEADHYPAILVGDFNAEPESDEIRYLRGHKVHEGRSIYFADAWRYGDDGFRDGNIAGDGVPARPGFTFARRNDYARTTREPSRRLDYVFVRGPDRKGRGEPLACRIVLDEQASDGTWPSDHFGVYAELSLE